MYCFCYFLCPPVKCYTMIGTKKRTNNVFIIFTSRSEEKKTSVSISSTYLLFM